MIEPWGRCRAPCSIVDLPLPTCLPCSEVEITGSWEFGGVPCVCYLFHVWMEMASRPDNSHPNGMEIPYWTLGIQQWQQPDLGRTEALLRALTGAVGREMAGHIHPMVSTAPGTWTTLSPQVCSGRASAKSWAHIPASYGPPLTRRGPSSVTGT